jgi:hypothetical protein
MSCHSKSRQILKKEAGSSTNPDSIQLFDLTQNSINPIQSVDINGNFTATVIATPSTPAHTSTSAYAVVIVPANGASATTIAIP